MRRIKGVNTQPEIAVRRLLHSMGYRFRLHRKDLPGTPDIVMPSKHVIVLVHGCFWHQHTGCRRATFPSTRREFWIPKLTRNAERDRQVGRQLRKLGWRVLTVWECEIDKLAKLEARVRRFLER